MENLDRIMEAARIAGISGGLGIAAGALVNTLMRPKMSSREYAITITALAPLASVMIADGTFGTNPHDALMWIASATALTIGAYLGSVIPGMVYLDKKHG